MTDDKKKRAFEMLEQWLEDMDNPTEDMLNDLMRFNERYLAKVSSERRVPIQDIVKASSFKPVEGCSQVLIKTTINLPVEVEMVVNYLSEEDMDYTHSYKIVKMSYPNLDTDLTDHIDDEEFDEITTSGIERLYDIRHQMIVAFANLDTEFYVPECKRFLEASTPDRFAGFRNMIEMGFMPVDTDLDLMEWASGRTDYERKQFIKAVDNERYFNHA